MKKPLSLPDDEPRVPQRADIPPDGGFTLIVDGHFKTRFEDEASAKAAAAELSTKYRMLQIDIYDAAKRERSRFT